MDVDAYARDSGPGVNDTGVILEAQLRLVPATYIIATRRLRKSGTALMNARILGAPRTRFRVAPLSLRHLSSAFLVEEPSARHFYPARRYAEAFGPFDSATRAKLCFLIYGQ
jgi:hypothetical protein